MSNTHATIADLTPSMIENAGLLGLKHLCKHMNIKGYSSLRKAEIQALLTTHMVQHACDNAEDSPEDRAFIEAMDAMTPQDTMPSGFTHVDSQDLIDAAGYNENAQSDLIALDADMENIAIGYEAEPHTRPTFNNAGQFVTYLARHARIKIPKIAVKTQPNGIFISSKIGQDKITRLKHVIGILHPRQNVRNYRSGILILKRK